MKPLVAVVDDHTTNLTILENILSDIYDIQKCCGGQEAVRFLQTTERLPQTILLDIIMPDMDGHEVLRVMKGTPRLRNIPVICVTTSNSEAESLAMGAADYISKPYNPEIVRLRVRNHVLLKQHTDDLTLLVAEKAEELISGRERVMLVLADIIEYRNLESGGHVKRVAYYADALIRYLLAHSTYAEELEQIGPEILVKSFPLHDVGKIGVPDRILLKPAKLTCEEFEMMKTHTTIGKTIVDSILYTNPEDSEYLRHCSEIAYSHHEWYNGAGYPLGLQGNKIPLSARIMAVADVYDALINRRVYKTSFGHETAVEMIKKESGTHFDPVIVHAFLALQETCRQIAAQNFVGV